MSEVLPIPTEFCAPQRKPLSATSGLMQCKNLAAPARRTNDPHCWPRAAKLYVIRSSNHQSVRRYSRIEWPEEMFSPHTGFPKHNGLRPGTPVRLHRFVSCTRLTREAESMTPSEHFLRFAAECESMAKFTHDLENKPVWRRLAERWVRCAELAERQNVVLNDAHHRRRHRQTET